MDRFRTLLVICLCLAVALTGRGPVTELAWVGQHHHHDAAQLAPGHSLGRAGSAAQFHPAGAQLHADRIAHAHAPGGSHHDGSATGDDDSCACGCGMGTCAALPADLLVNHPALARIGLRIDLPIPRVALVPTSPMAPLLRPPIC